MRRPSEPRLLALRSIASLLGADRQLANDVTVAWRDPLACFESKRKDLSLEEPVSDLAWLVLLRGLQARDLLWIVDWREFPGEAARILARLWRAHGGQPRAAWAWVTPEMDNGKTKLAAFLDRAAREMKPHGVVLAWLDAGSDDDFALVILAEDAVREATDLARAAGYSIGTTFSKRPRAKRLFRPIAVPVPNATPLLAPSPLWRTIRTGLLPLDRLSEADRSSLTGNTLYGKGERPVAHAEVLGWDRNENPRSLATPSTFDHVVLTNRRIVFARLGLALNAGEPTVHLDHVEKKQVAFFPTGERRGMGVLRVADWTGTRTRGTWKLTTGFRWLVCDDAFAGAFTETVRQTPRARLPR